jgi:hypothetical protein
VRVIVSAFKDSRAYSVRLSGADLRKLKALSERLGSTESDVVRFALRYMLNRLSPLHDLDVSGATLLPVFVDLGRELIANFDLDESSLDRILNGKSENGRRVDREDISLLLMAGLESTRLNARLAELNGKPMEHDSTGVELKDYLYGKYLFDRH